MGKLLSLGPNLRYPIVINKLLKAPKDDIKKKQPLFRYSFKWMKMVGDALHDEEWEEEQTTYADWDSPSEGTVLEWKIREGQSIERDTTFVEIEETCAHSVQFAGLCGMCGKDMTDVSWASASTDTERATINMIHDQTSLTVSEETASKAESELQRRLLNDKKLSLVVDLDQTIIHACVDSTVGDWQRDPNSPNHEAVKDVKAFQLDDGAPRGLASRCWYYIKMRPGLKEFLEKVSQLYELHVYTMGTRAYALSIAKIVDPEKKLFGDRIISRDENGNMTAKRLERLFPVDTKMVVIIDDRADVWPMNRANLIKVHPYEFFAGIGDINSSFLPKREELPKVTPVENSEKTADSTESRETVAAPSEDAQKPADNASSNGEESTAEPKPEADGPRVSALEELVRMGAGSDEALREEQAAEQERYLEKQLTDRPLLHMQQELEKEEEEEAKSEQTTPEKKGDTAAEQPHHKHHLLKDNDEELKYLEEHLSSVHKAFYDEYNSAMVSAQGGRLALLKAGRTKKIPIKDDTGDLQIVPDIGEVMPNLKAQVLKGTTLVLSGLIPLGQDPMKSDVVLQATSFGAKIQTKVSKYITHVVAPTNKTRTHKVRQAAKYPKIKIVNQQWLLDTFSQWRRQDEAKYLVEIHEQDRKRDGPPSISSTNDSEGNDDDTDDELGSEEDPDTVSASQEEEEADADGVMPSEYDGGHSPIDDLTTFDWGGADDELAEFMNSDSGSDSDTSSVASDSSRASKLSLRGVKRKNGQVTATDDEESDEGSATTKRQRVSNSRTTGLKTVKTPNSAQSESSLPTPGPTDENEGEGKDGGEDDEEGDDGWGDGDGDLDLEAELEAEFEREALAAAAADQANDHANDRRMEDGE